MRILRPALLGFFIAFLVVGGLILLPQRTSDTVTEEGKLPPKLFPIFPFQGKEETERVERRKRPRSAPRITVERAPMSREVTSGTSFWGSITIDNISEENLQELEVEERFDDSFLTVDDAQGAIVERNIVTWSLPSLEAGERWSKAYTLSVRPEVLPRTLELTTFVRGGGLEDTPSSSRMVTSTLTIIPLPRTGIQIPSLLRFLWSL